MLSPAACLRGDRLGFWLVLAVHLALANAAWPTDVAHATVGRAGLGRHLLQQESGVLTLTSLLQQNCTARFCPCRNSFKFARNGDALKLTSVTGTGLGCTTAQQLELMQLPDENGRPSGTFSNKAADINASGRQLALTPDIDEVTWSKPYGAYMVNTLQFGDDNMTNEYDGCQAIYAVTTGTLLGVTTSTRPSVAGCAAAQPSSQQQASSSNNKKSCFSGSSVVETPTGAKTMRDLAIGDKVLVAKPGQTPYFEEVFMFSHQERISAHPFILIGTDSTQPLHVSAGHYLWTTRMASEAPTLLRAAAVRPGDTLWVTSTSTATGAGSRVTRGLTPAAVTFIGKAQDVGLYNPHTASGSIIVNGIAASTFTDVLPASLLAHGMVTYPGRILYHALHFKAAREWVNTLLMAAFSEMGEVDLKAIVPWVTSSH